MSEREHQGALQYGNIYQVDGSLGGNAAGRREGDGLGETACALEGTDTGGGEAPEGRGYSRAFRNNEFLTTIKS